MILNNLILSKAGKTALSEALTPRQPGDVFEFTMKDKGGAVVFSGEAELVENLPDRATFDIELTGADATSSDEDDEERAPTDSPLAATVLGVMGSKGKPANKK